MYILNTYYSVFYYLKNELDIEYKEARQLIRENAFYDNVKNGNRYYDKLRNYDFQTQKESRRITDKSSYWIWKTEKDLHKKLTDLISSESQRLVNIDKNLDIINKTILILDKESGFTNLINYLKGFPDSVIIQIRFVRIGKGKDSMLAVILEASSF